MMPISTPPTSLCSSAPEQSLHGARCRQAQNDSADLCTTNNRCALVYMSVVHCPGMLRGFGERVRRSVASGAEWSGRCNATWLASLHQCLLPPFDTVK